MTEHTQSSKPSSNRRHVHGPPSHPIKIALLAVASLLLHAMPSVHAQTLKTITTLRELHALRTEQALLGYPVHVRAIITNYFPGADASHAVGWLHDPTGSIYFEMTAATGGTPAVGSIVEVDGVSDPGNFAPTLTKAHLQVVGAASLPDAKPVTLTWLKNGPSDSVWVEVEGIVRSVDENDRPGPEHQKDEILRLAMADGIINVTTLREPNVDYTKLVDARLRLRANASPVFNENRQILGVRLVLPNTAAIQVLEPGPVDPFGLPVRTISKLAQFDQEATTTPHRIHVQGHVTLQWPNSWLCVGEKDDAICAQTVMQTPVQLGDMLDIVGFEEDGGVSPVLTDAIYRVYGDSHPIAPVPIDVKEAMTGRLDSVLVRIEGRLVTQNLLTTDTSLMVESGDTVFTVLLPRKLAGDAGRKWQAGSLIRVTGILSVKVDTDSSARAGGTAMTTSFAIRLRSPEDVVVLQHPSWWTPAHTVVVLSCILVAALAALGWVMALKRRVGQQVEVIRERSEQVVSLQESENHYRDLARLDGLTQLPNRREFDSFLDISRQRAIRQNTPLSLLLIDIDHFKRLNDQHGHTMGDEYLRKVAAAVAFAVPRKTDLVARYGGEEFGVILDTCDDPGAFMVAERIKASIAVLSKSLLAAHRPGVTVSIGMATTLPSLHTASKVLIDAADQGLYTAKRNGRDRIERGTDLIGNAAAQAAAQTETQAV